MTYDLVIVGGGPAGASAAIFAGRSGLLAAVVDAGNGMAPKALVNNHLGLEDGVDGPDLLARGRRQAEASGAEWIEDVVTSLTVENDLLALGTESGRSLTAREVLLAQGTNVALATAAGIDIEAGREPWIKSVVSVDGAGRTSVPHVWAAGTLAGTSVHSIVVAGDAARVAINIISELRGERHVDHDSMPTPAAPAIA